MSETAVGSGQSAVGGGDDAAAAVTSPSVEWAIVEIFGHRRHAGKVSEEERFGAKMLRVDQPKFEVDGSVTWTTHYYGGASIFGITPTDEATVMRAARPYDAPHRYITAPRDADVGDDDAF